MRALFLLPLLLSGCAGETLYPGETDPQETDDTDVGDTEDTDPGFPSTYSDGKYKVSSLSINAESDGIDVNGDGTPENNLPNALKLIDLAMPDFDLSRENLNAILADTILSGDLIYLIQAKHYQGELIMDWYPGEADFNGAVSPAARGYDSSGYPISRLRGDFSDERAFKVGPGEMTISMLLLPPPQPFVDLPFELAHVQGTIWANECEGIIGGAIPADILVEDIIEPLIPEEGVDTDGDGVINLSKEAIMTTVRNLAANEGVSDVDLGDGRRGVSSAMQFTALPTTWD